jgi:hypothetical protein
MIQKFLFFSICLINCTQVFSQKTEWKFIKETKDVKVYYREIPNKSLKEVKIQTVFDADINTIVEVLREVSSYPKWVYKAVYSKKLKEISPNEMIYYNKLDFPWPLTDRDVVIHTKVTKGLNEAVSISYATEDPKMPKNEMVRISEFNSKWTLKQSGQKVNAEYVFSSNPGGNIPVWMVNMSLEDGPIKTIANLKKQISENKK